MRKLRKRSKSKATLDRADYALQCWYRREFDGKPCEGCGRPFQVMHHHIEKSLSNAGRYWSDNLIFLCHKCHASIHFQNHNVVAIYSIKRGSEWLERMKQLRTVRKQYYTKKELEEIINKYQ